MHGLRQLLDGLIHHGALLCVVCDQARVVQLCQQIVNTRTHRIGKLNCCPANPRRFERLWAQWCRHRPRHIWFATGGSSTLAESSNSATTQPCNNRCSVPPSRDNAGPPVPPAQLAATRLAPTSTLLNDACAPSSGPCAGLRSWPSSLLLRSRPRALASNSPSPRHAAPAWLQKMRPSL